MHPSHLARRTRAGLLLAALALVGVATAAPADPQPDSGPAPAPALTAADVNPMTATPLAIEALRRKLAEAQLQARLEAELTNIERSRSERRRLAQGEPANLAAARAGGADASLAAATSAAATTRPSVAPPRRNRDPRQDGALLQAAASRGAAGAASSLAPPAPLALPAGAPGMTPRLVGVIHDGRSDAALVEIQGRVVRIEADSSAAGVSVGAVGDNQAIIDARLQHVPAAANRIALPTLASSAASPSAAAATAPSSATGAAESLFPGLTLGVPSAPAGTRSEPQSTDPLHDPAPLRP